MPEFTEHITDPTDGVEYTFTGSTPQELDDKVDAHFNPPLPTDDPDAADGPLAGLSTDELHARLDELKAAKAAAEPALDKYGAKYAGTPEGLAKIQRMMELADDDDVRKDQYRRWLTQGVGRLADEAEQRKAKDYRPEHQGPYEPLPLPDASDALVQFVKQNRIMGIYKVDDTQIMSGQTQTVLYHMPSSRNFYDDAADSVKSSYPTIIVPGDGVSLLDVLVETPRDKILKLLGLDLGEALLDTIDQV